MLKNLGVVSYIYEGDRDMKGATYIIHYLIRIFQVRNTDEPKMVNGTSVLIEGKENKKMHPYSEPEDEKMRGRDYSTRSSVVDDDGSKIESVRNERPASPDVGSIGSAIQLVNILIYLIFRLQ